MSVQSQPTLYKGYGGVVIYVVQANRSAHLTGSGHHHVALTMAAGSLKKVQNGLY